MLTISPMTASAIAPHMIGRGFVMFVATTGSTNELGPILIEPVTGAKLGERLGVLARDNAYPTWLIGLLESTTPEQHAQQIAAQCDGACLHDRWYAPTGNLLGFINQSATQVIRDLLALTNPAALPTEPVDIDEMARLLDVSVPTIRRMVSRGEIPFMRTSGVRGVLRFIPEEVFASLQQRR